MRITNLYVEVAGTHNTGNLKVFRQYASVLYYDAPSTNTYASANSVMSLTDEARTLWIPAHVTDPLGLTDNADGTGVKNISLTTVMSLTDKAEKATYASASDELDLVDYLDYFNIVSDRKPAGNELALIQTVLTLSGIQVEQDLGLVSTANGYGPYKLYPSHYLYLQQRLPTPHRKWIEHELGLLQIAPTPLFRTITDTLGLVDIVSMTNILHELNLVQIASFGKLFEVAQELGIDHSVFLTSYWNRLTEHDLGIGHALTWFDDSPCTRKRYSPFQGENTVNTIFAQPPAALPVIQKDASVDRFVLYYPSHDAIAKQLILRAPELDNADRNAYTRITEETRGGSLIVFSDPIWPKIRSLIVTVVGLTKAEVDEYLDFLYETIGLSIEVCDWEGRLWSGVITNPEEPVVQDGKERFTISFILEGSTFEDEMPEANNDGSALSISDQADFVLETP